MTGEITTASLVTDILVTAVAGRGARGSSSQSSITAV
jgi:hypothetical protein